MQPIEFRAGNAFLLRDARPHDASTASQVIAAEIHLPASGRAPYPAVVLSQGLSGVSASRERRYAAMLARSGIAALVFDSFAARSASGLAHPGRALNVSETMLLGDAFAALALLAARSDIRAEAISIVGFSYGGMISVLAAYRQIAETFLPGGPRFLRHIAYYGCSIPRLDDPTTTGAPVSMLVGARDRNVDLHRTAEIAGDLRRGGSPVDLTVYPELYHQWEDADAGERFIFLRLARSRMRVGRDGRVRDERTGIMMNGWWSRAAMIALSTDPTGYRISPNAEGAAASDAQLLATLGGGSPAGGAAPSQVPSTRLAGQKGTRRTNTNVLPEAATGG